MVNNQMNIIQARHPLPSAEKEYQNLIGIEDQKESTLLTLSLFLDSEKIRKWREKHYKKHSFPLLDLIINKAPLIIFSGEVGCGKTALAQSIATPLAKKLDRSVFVFESPSNIRGSGLVGELSNRITELFTLAKGKLGKDNLGILIIDEADDIATSRAQNQAHHEDRAGLNVLVKQIDLISKEEYKLAVILITNRIDVLDPAVRRRASIHLIFERPRGRVLEEVFEYIFESEKLTKGDLKILKEISESKSIQYSFSDLLERAPKQAIHKAVHRDIPFSVNIYSEVLSSMEPSPLIEETSISKMNQNGQD